MDLVNMQRELAGKYSNCKHADINKIPSLAVLKGAVSLGLPPSIPDRRRGVVSPPGD